jgi:hypothetical protein
VRRCLHRPLDPRATRAARQPRTLVVSTAVEFTPRSVFEEKGVEVEQQAVAHGAATVTPNPMRPSPKPLKVRHSRNPHFVSEAKRFGGL